MYNAVRPQYCVSVILDFLSFSHSLTFAAWQVRETNDHGPLNSWSRMGWQTIEAGPTPSYGKQS